MKILKNIALGLIGLAVAFIGYIMYETQDEINATPANMDSRLAEYYDAEEMAGFAVAVFNGEEVFYQNAFGFADIEKQIPYTVNTQQYVASIAKTMIGVALLKTQEIGLLNLNDPINQHLPFEVHHPDFPQQPITILQLTTHTSGLAYNEQFVESLYIADSLKDDSLLPIMNDYFTAGTYGEVSFLETAPGMTYEYSNIGAGLAALIVERVTQQSFADFTQQQIFEPLEMNETTWTVDTGKLQFAANYYAATDSVTLELATNDGVQLYPCRDLYTNVIDLTRYGQAIIRQDKKLLSNDAFQQLLAPQLSGDISNQLTDNQAIFFSY
ncbi:MAG: serine hydrolase domain-containing protein, partial [Saprospiraceae bacterium]